MSALTGNTHPLTEINWLSIRLILVSPWGLMLVGLATNRSLCWFWAKSAVAEAPMSKMLRNPRRLRDFFIRISLYVGYVEIAKFLVCIGNAMGIFNEYGLYL